MADENRLSALRAFAGQLPETMHDRKAKERRATSRNDGRANRERQPVITLTVGLPPEIKPRINSICRRHDMLIKDFILECLEWGFDKYEPK